MIRGTFIGVVGPSGAGKDTVMRAVQAARPDIVAARRVISRPADDATEVFDSVTPKAFEDAAQAGDFVLHWQAHGLGYGIPQAVNGDLTAGRHVMANLSRGVVDQMRVLFDPALVLVITAPINVLAERLAARGRETPDDIAERLNRALYAAPSGPDVREIMNDGPLDRAVADVLAVLPQPVEPVRG